MYLKKLIAGYCLFISLRSVAMEEQKKRILDIIKQNKPSAEVIIKSIEATKRGEIAIHEYNDTPSNLMMQFNSSMSFVVIKKDILKYHVSPSMFVQYYNELYPKKMDSVESVANGCILH